MQIVKILFIFFVITTSFKFSFTQDYGYGVGLNFSPWEIDNSSVTIKISKNKLLKKIVEHFCGKDFVDDSANFEKSELQKMFYEDIEKISRLGFGNREIIRLILIRQKVPLTTKSLIPIAQLCIKKGSVKSVAEQFGLNYEKDIWLDSNNIYNKIIIEE